MPSSKERPTLFPTTPLLFHGASISDASGKCKAIKRKRKSKAIKRQTKPINQPINQPTVSNRPPRILNINFQSCKTKIQELQHLAHSIRPDLFYYILFVLLFYLFDCSTHVTGMNIHVTGHMYIIHVYL